MSLDRATKLGPFRVDPVGRLHPNEPGSNPSFDFSWRRRRVHAVMRGESLSLVAVLGRVPSTGGAAKNGEWRIPERERVFSVLRFLQKSIPPGWQLRLLVDHRVRVDAEEPLEWPTTAAGLMISVTLFLLTLAPYLDLLDETGLSGIPLASGGAGGRLKI